MKRKTQNTQNLAKVVAAQIRDLKGMRQMAATLMRRLRRDMRDLSGEKELKHCIDEMAKLSQVQLKIIPLETELMQLMPDMGDASPKNTAEDDAILERAFKRWQEREDRDG